MKKYKPIDWAILILTAAVAMTLVAEVIAGEFFYPESERERLLDEMFSGIIAILSMWFGRHLSQNKTMLEEDQDREKLMRHIKDHADDFWSDDKIQKHIKKTISEESNDGSRTS